MFLNIILTLLVIILIVITVLLTIWWRKHGKKLFDMITGFKSLKNGVPNLNMDANIMGDLSERLKKLNEAFGNIKKR